MLKTEKVSIKKKSIKNSNFPVFLYVFVWQGGLCDEEAFEHSFTGQAWSWHTQRKVSHFIFFSYYFISFT